MDGLRSVIKVTREFAVAKSKIATEVVLLVVGNHDVVRNRLVAMLRRAGLCVLTAKTGEEALDLSRRFTDKLALMTDIEIGQMTGIELYRRIREQRPETSVLFIGDNIRGVCELFPDAQVFRQPILLLEHFDQVKRLFAPAARIA